MAAPAMMTRKYSAYGLTLWRLPERPSRAGVYFQARPHYALAPRHWSAEQVWTTGLVYLSYEDALVGLGRVASYLACDRQKATPAAGLYDYVRMQHGYGLRTPEDWREQVNTGAEVR